jgi:ribosomal protein L18E
MLVPDLCALVCDYSSDSSLLKLSMCSKTLHNMLTHDNHPIWRSKAYNVRLLKHKYNVASTKLERIHRRIRAGQLVDVVKLAE